MEKRKKVILIWTSIFVLFLIPLWFIIFIFFFKFPVHEELIDSIYIPTKNYTIKAYYCDQGAPGDWISLRKEYKNGKSYSIYYLDVPFNSFKKMELLDDNKLKVVLGFNDPDTSKSVRTNTDTIYIDLNLLETEERKAIQQRIIKFLIPGIFMLIGIIMIIFRKGFKYKIKEKKRSEYMIRYGIILIIISLYLFVFLSRMYR